MTDQLPTSTDLLVVGAGPAGSAAAAWAARSGLNVVLADKETFPRDKTCGDGLTPRAIAELDRLGLSEWLADFPVNRGLRACGFGQELQLPWPGGSLPGRGSAVPRTVLDNRIREEALASGARGVENARAIDVLRDGNRVIGVVFAGGKDKPNFTIGCRRLVVADGVRSQLGRVLGREWHQNTAFGVAARAYIKSGRSEDEWITSHLELRGAQNELLPGYGWVFPLGDGEVNIGVGALATEKRPADVHLKDLIGVYAGLRRDDWELEGEPRAVRSAMLPMGGAVSGVAGSNWALIGDAAGCVNPLNGEGIDYGLETGRLVAELFAAGAGTGRGTGRSYADLNKAWPATLQEHYGTSFSIARRLATLLTVPGVLKFGGPVGMRSNYLMTIALRVMGNLVLEEDKDYVARLWRNAGRLSQRFDDRVPFGQIQY
ncbi:geranylgeranyl reductase family protein [Kineosporia babensis]|uniref:Geranylgeranyl reductase family protein n=1 Tax=Kineosporia babensis TaxID=499548 RepID=A0A9X1N8W5_9ACTN|nr:geranylgeranyl reductase family protein [Kineosporia babensis]MCD5309300.1 geranylgeranyl reductase family protein [Kineosporia babensis]